MKKYTTDEKARAKAEKILHEIKSLGFVLKASVVQRHFKCGKPGCRCAKGQFHHDVIVTRRVGGKTQTFRVRKGREQDAISWLQNWRRLKELLDQLTAVEIDILRMPMQDSQSKGHTGKTQRQTQVQREKDVKHNNQTGKSS